MRSKKGQQREPIVAMRTAKKKNVVAVKRQKSKPKSLRSAPKIDQGWWLDQLDRTRKSQAQVARDIGMDYGAFNRTLKGKRMITPLENEKLAAALNVPLDEVQRAWGLNPDAGATQKHVPVKGHVDETGLVTSWGEPDEPRTAPPPTRVPVETQALRYHTFGTPAAFRDGWVAYFVPRPGIHPEALGRYCLVHVRGEKGEDGSRYVRVLHRSRKVGLYCLKDPSGHGADYDDVRVLSAVPIIWIRC